MAHFLPQTIQPSILKSDKSVWAWMRTVHAPYKRWWEMNNYSFPKQGGLCVIAQLSSISDFYCFDLKATWSTECLHPDPIVFKSSFYEPLIFVPVQIKC